MKETELISQDDIKSLIEMPVLKEQKMIGRWVKKPGHTLFELNLKTGLIKPAEYESVTGIYNPDTKMKVGVSHKLVIREGCYYECALNLKNARRKFIKVLNNK